MEAKGVQTLERALDIIELLTIQREGMGVTDIGARLNLHKSTVHRLLSSLAERGYVEKENSRSTYRLGLKFVEIGSLRLNQLELKTEASPILRYLAERSRQPVHLAILDGADAVYIEKVEAVSNLRMYAQIGRRIPAYCSAIGKALLIDLNKTDLEALVSKISFVRHSPKTRLGIQALTEGIEQGKKLGWTMDDEEHEENIICVASPIRDYTASIIASVSASGDRQIMTQDRIQELSLMVIDCALTISRRMGYISR